MKRSTLLVFGSVACLLIGCGKMKQITDEQAKEIAKGIMTKQDDPQLFTDPNNFIFKNQYEEHEEAFERSGKRKDTQKNETVFMIDVDNLVSYSYSKTVSDTYESETYETTFYAVGDAKIYTLYNKNGYKYRSELTNVTMQTARSQFIYNRNSYKDYYRWRGYNYPFTLNNFDYYLEQAKALHEKFKDEEDQYYNYYLGSNDAKSLQVTVDQKTKYESSSDYKGYNVSNYDIKISNNLLDSFTSTGETNLIGVTDSRFYQKSKANSLITMTYGNAKIDIPNINDYPLEQK